MKLSIAKMIYRMNKERPICLMPTETVDVRGTVPDPAALKNKSGWCRCCEYKFRTEPCCVCSVIHRAMPVNHYKEVEV